MLGISWAEFLIILLVAVLVIPTKNWPDVARFLARVVKVIRSIIWKVTDASEQIKDRIDLEQPINDILQTTTDDVLAQISTPIKKKTSARKRQSKKGAK